MIPFFRSHPGRWLPAMILLLGVATLPLQALQIDRSNYLSPDELQPGMKGYGRTVMSGTEIQRFNFEVISVMRNAFYAKQDVILVRCSGLNLEHSGIIGGMSGSPCYVQLEDGTEKMIGAVAYGWQFNKDPICGVQPITQMLPIAELRDPALRPEPDNPPVQVASASRVGLPLGELIADVWSKPLASGTRFSIFNEQIKARNLDRPDRSIRPEQMQPLRTPLMISGGAARQIIEHHGDFFTEMNFEPVVSGGASAATRAAAGDIDLEPGSVISVPLMTGDMNIDAIGTCTEVIDGNVLGFGHAMDAQGWVELPVATGMIHTVIPSVMRSNKIGASLQTVGTLWGDESSGIFGIVGDKPRMVPVEVTVKSNVREPITYRYEMVQNERMTPMLMSMAMMESAFAHSQPPREHTINYTIETEFEEIGTYQVNNTISQEGVFSAAYDLQIPTMTLLNSPFGRTKVKSAKVEMNIEPQAQLSSVDAVSLPKTRFQPGETIPVAVRWMHFRSNPNYTNETYRITLPETIPDGTYSLMVGAATMHMSALQSQKPHLFSADNLPEVLERFNAVADVRNNALYLHLVLPEIGVAVDQVEMPNLPSFQRKIYQENVRSDVNPYRESLIESYSTDWVVRGGKTLPVIVDRRADQ